MNEKITVPLKRHHEVDLFFRARISRICMAAVAVNEAKKKTSQNLVTHRDVSPSLEESANIPSKENTTVMNLIEVI